VTLQTKNKFSRCPSLAKSSARSVIATLSRSLRQVPTSSHSWYALASHVGSHNLQTRNL
jgi:hypothetical protein